MKAIDEWGSDEWITAGVICLVGYGLGRMSWRWAQGPGRTWLLSHHLMLGPHQGSVSLGSFGSLDAVRVIAVAAAAVILAAVIRLVVGVALSTLRPTTSRAAEPSTR